MKICFLLGGFVGNGGIGRVTSILANQLCDIKGIEIFTLSFFYQSDPNLYKISSKVNQDFLLPQKITMKKAIICNAIGKLHKYLIINDIDILIASGALYFPLAVYACNNYKTKCICWEHSNVFNKADYKFQMLSRRIGSRKADAIVTLTKADQKNYIDKYHILNVKQIYNPIDQSIYNYDQKYNSNSHKIITVGRLTYQKNLFLLLDIAAEILGYYAEWEWHIYGEGEDRQALQEKIIKLNLENKVILKGQDSSIYQKYCDYSFMVMTSRYEGFPMSLLEGLANGLPLISFDVETGPNEIIEHNKTGLLVPPFSKKDMCKAIKYLIDNPNIRIEMSNTCKKRRQGVFIENIIEKWVTLFNELCGSKSI